MNTGFVIVYAFTTITQCLAFANAHDDPAMAIRCDKFVEQAPAISLRPKMRPAQ